MGLICAVFSIIIWGITFVSTKSLLSDFTPLEILFYRFLIAYLALWCIRPKIVKIARKDNLYFALAGLTGVVLYQFFENVAISYTAASNVSVIVAICPLFTAIVAQIFLKEKHITPFFIAGFVISIIGVALVSLNGKGNLSISPKGDFLALLSSICWGFYSLFVSIINSRKYDPICSTRRVFFFAVIFMIPLVIYGNLTGSVDLSAAVNSARFGKFVNWMNLCFLGVFASSLCFSAWNKACNLLGTIRVSNGLYLIPVVTIIFARIFLNETITWMGAAGALITIAGLFLSSYKKSK